MTTAAKGQFTTSGVGDVLSVRGLTFAPKAVVAWWSQQDDEGVESGNRGGIGFWGGAGTAAVAWTSRNGAATVRARTIAEPVGLLGLDDPGAEPSMRAELAGFDPDGFRLRWLLRPERPWVVHYLALGGPGLAVEVGWRPAPSAPQMHELGFRASGDQVVLFAPTAVLPGSDQREGLALGIGMVGPGGQAAATYAARDGASPGSVTGAQSASSALLLAQEDGSLAMAGKAFLDGPAATIDWTAAGPDAGQICFLALRGLRASVGTHLSPSRPGRRRTKVGFPPEALLLFSWGLSPAAHPKGIGRLCIGATSGDSTGCAGWDDRNGTGEMTYTHCVSSSTSILVVTDTDTETGGVHAEALLHSLDRRGFTLDWKASDGKEREFAYLALATPRSARRRVRFPKR